MILVSYDGSADAQAAIDRAAELMPGAETVVLTVWEPFVEMLAHTGAAGFGLGMSGAGADVEGIDTRSAEAAMTTATEGAARASAAGLSARPMAFHRHGGVANTILSTATDLDADLVVLGTRGLGAFKSLLLGSVSQTVVQHADRAVLVVPSAVLAEDRHHWVHADMAYARSGDPSAG